MAKRERSRLRRRVDGLWEPEFTPELKSWARKQIIANRWRYDRLNTMEDLMQDAEVAFLKVKDGYPACNEPARFTALFKTTFRNMLWDRAREYERKLLVHWENMSTDDPNLDIPDLIGDVTNMGVVASMFYDGPPELKMLLEYLSVDENLEKLREPQRAKWHEPRQTINQRLSQALGIKYFDFRGSMEQWLTA